MVVDLVFEAGIASGIRAGLAFENYRFPAGQD